MKTLETFSNLDEAGGHRQNELCSHRLNTVGFYLYEESTRVKLREAESRIVVAETRGRGKWGSAVCM